MYKKILTTKCVCVCNYLRFLDFLPLEDGKEKDGMFRLWLPLGLEFKFLNESMVVIFVSNKVNLQGRHFEGSSGSQ